MAVFRYAIPNWIQIAAAQSIDGSIAGISHSIARINMNSSQTHVAFNHPCHDRRAHFNDILSSRVSSGCIMLIWLAGKCTPRSSRSNAGMDLYGDMQDGWMSRRDAKRTQCNKSRNGRDRRFQMVQYSSLCYILL